MACRCGDRFGPRIGISTPTPSGGDAEWKGSLTSALKLAGVPSPSVIRMSGCACVFGDDS